MHYLFQGAFAKNRDYLPEFDQSVLEGLRDIASEAVLQVAVKPNMPARRSHRPCGDNLRCIFADVRTSIGSGSENNKFLALKNLGVGEFQHLNGNLESHLLGTYKLLIEWNNPGYVCDAGLYHAVYGTQPMKRLGIPHKEYAPSDRPRIREIIGKKSEQLVYLYGACDRDYLYPKIGSPNPVYRDRFTGEEQVLSSGILRELLEITMANELEICISGPSPKESHRPGLVELFDRFYGLVSEKAHNHYRSLFGI